MSILSKFGPSVFVAMISTGLMVSTGAATYAQDTPITVTVNAQPIDFDGTQPTETGGAVLVPLRGVFEALHATVDYDPNSQTITATRGQQTVLVTIGSNKAIIDGQTQFISQPAEVVAGSTMVPLRFVAEALGDYVEWSGDTHTVSITRQDNPQGMAENPPMNSPPPMNMPQQSGWTSSDRDVVMGELQHVQWGQNYVMITVLSRDGQSTLIPLTRDVVVERGRHRNEASLVSLSDLHPGDRVFVHENDQGRGITITAIYGQQGM